MGREGSKEEAGWGWGWGWGAAGKDSGGWGGRPLTVLRSRCCKDVGGREGIQWGSGGGARNRRGAEDSIEDQLTLASMHCQRSHFQEVGGRGRRGRAAGDGELGWVREGAKGMEEVPAGTVEGERSALSRGEGASRREMLGWGSQGRCTGHGAWRMAG